MHCVLCITMKIHRTHALKQSSSSKACLHSDANLKKGRNFERLIMPLKLMKTISKFQVVKRLLGKYFHLAPIWYFYLFSFGNDISFIKYFAYFIFAVAQKKNAFLQNGLSLASKWLKIQAWDWSRLTDFLNIFKISLSNKYLWSLLNWFY